MPASVFLRYGLFMVISASVFLAGCCTMVYCVGIDDMDEIWFYGFESKMELDTIVVKKYARNSGFAKLLDDPVVFRHENMQTNSDFQIVRLPERLKSDFDYKIEVPAAGKTFKVSDFVSKKKQCNTGFLCIDYYNALESYRVDGALVTGDWKVSLRK